MQQLLYIGKRRLVWREGLEPQLLAEGDALVRPFIATRCDGDGMFLLHDYERALRFGAKLGVVDPAFGSRNTNPFSPPFAYGHEGVAEVLQCGPSVKNFRRGDIVIVPWAISCGTCMSCAEGRTSTCAATGRCPSTFGFGAAFGSNGGMLSDCVRVPKADAMLVRAPVGVDPIKLASASDNITDGYRAVAEPLRKRPHSPVLIVGGAAASIGLYAAGIAVALGGSPVDYADTSHARLDVAERLGANPIQIAPGERGLRIGAAMHRERYAISVDARSSTASLHYAIRALAPGGICSAVGFYVRRGTPLPLWEMYMKGVTLEIGLSHARASLPATLDLIASGRFDPGLVTSLVADWQDAPRVFTERGTKPVVQRHRITTHTPQSPPSAARSADSCR
jgi:threonine dehydrogenase-like Zn-dependent dehydrogenase